MTDPQKMCAVLWKWLAALWSICVVNGLKHIKPPVWLFKLSTASKWMQNKLHHSSLVRWCVLSLSVWSQYQRSSTTLSPSASKDFAQTPTPAPVPASIFCSEAQTCWSNTRWDEAPASARECRPPCFLPILPLSNPVHVKSPPAPQGGGWTHLWGDHYLLFHIFNLFLLFMSLSSF